MIDKLVANAQTSSIAVIAYVALGANLGDRALNLSSAIKLLDDGQSVRVLAVSTYVDNPAVGGPSDSPAFLNAVAQVQTTLTASALLDRLLTTERQLGRQRNERWGPRSIDMDLILFGDEVIDLPGLSVPHPRMHERRFVIGPLAEIAPHAVHPVLHQTAAQLLAQLDAGCPR